MTSTCNPYLSLAGRAREAMEFYQSLFGGDLTIQTFQDAGAEGFGADPQGVMHSQLTTVDGWVLMASDGAGEEKRGGPVTIALMGPEQQLREWFDALFADGGEVYMPYEKQMWGDVFGSGRDRFGIEWNINGSPES